MNVDGSDKPVRLTTGNHRGAYVPAWSLSWSPDSSQIAFPSNRDGNHEIYTMNMDGSNQRNITNSSTDEGAPAWSPDGGWLAFVRVIRGQQEIFLMTRDGGSVTNLTRDSAQDWDPAWLP